MKTILIFAISMLVTLFVFAQNLDVEEVNVTPPQFTGIQNVIQSQDESATTLIRNYLKDNINYPENAKLCKREGAEVVQFTVTTKRKWLILKQLTTFILKLTMKLYGYFKKSMACGYLGTTMANRLT
jgi:hypothetical protein